MMRTEGFPEGKNHYAIIFQITQECPFNCDICLRFYNPGEKSLSEEDRFRMVDILKQRDVRSISVTGGEPLVLKERLFDFLRYLHKKQIHTCLATTGFSLTKEQICSLDDCLDRIVISIRSIALEDWKTDFGNSPFIGQLYKTSFDLLKWIKETNIVMEVTSVLHRENIDNIIDLGYRLASINPNIVWRVDEYYPIGKEANNHKRFELANGEFKKASKIIKEELSSRLNEIRFSSWADRMGTPGLLITQSGEIMTSAGVPTGCNILRNEFPSEFMMSRPWTIYRKVLRDWGWGDM